MEQVEGINARKPSLGRSATVARPAGVPEPRFSRPSHLDLSTLLTGTYPVDIGEPAPIVDPSDDSSLNLPRPSFTMANSLTQRGLETPRSYSGNGPSSTGTGLNGARNVHNPLFDRGVPGLSASVPSTPIASFASRDSDGEEEGPQSTYVSETGEQSLRLRRQPTARRPSSLAHSSASAPNTPRPLVVAEEDPPLTPVPAPISIPRPIQPEGSPLQRTSTRNLAPVMPDVRVPRMSRVSGGSVEDSKITPPGSKFYPPQSPRTNFIRRSSSFSTSGTFSPQANNIPQWGRSRRPGHSRFIKKGSPIGRLVSLWGVVFPNFGSSLVGLTILALSAAFLLQYVASMGVELRALRSQNAMFATQGDGAQEPGHGAPAPVNWPPGVPMPEQIPHAPAMHSPPPLESISAWWSASMRLLAALLALACCVGSVHAWRRLDSLPSWLQGMIKRYLSLDDKSAASVAETDISLSKHVAYKLDYWFSRNPWAKALSLIYVTVALIYLGGLGIYSASGQPLHEAFWEAIAGAGFNWKFSDAAVTGVGLSGFLMRAVSVVVSIGGMLITALLLGIVSDSIADSMEGMRKGKSDVLESGHTLVLGWSDKLLAIIDQICNANVSEGGRPIVILAERDKESMEEEINVHSPNLRGSRVICRSGNPLLSLDLSRVSAERARTIIVLASGSGPAQSDARVLRITLSLMGLHDSRMRLGQPGLQGHIVAEVCDMDNDALVHMVGGDMVETVVSHDIIGRLMIQCARQPGLASVWEQLLGFDGGCSQDNLSGDEFYIREWPQLVGRSFQEVLLSFPLALPVGLKLAASGEVKLNPDDNYIICEGDKIIVLAEDDDTYRPSATLPSITEDLDPNPEWRSRPKKEKVLFIGWRRDMHDMISVLDQFVAQGSELYLYNEVPHKLRTEILVKGGLNPASSLKNIKLIYESAELEGDPVDRKRLEMLNPERFSSILILADDSNAIARKEVEAASIADADSRCLASLLLLRDIQSTRMPMGHSRLATVAGGQKKTSNMTRKSWFGADLAAAAAANDGLDQSQAASTHWYNTLMGAVRQTVVISEILDSRTRNLIAELHVGEFVLSNELVSMTLAMVSESREVNTILTELFTPNGNELYVLPAARFLGPSETLNFYEVLLRARARQEIVIGYKNFGMEKPVVNPKDKEARVLSVDLTDTLVVLSLGLDSETVRNKELQMMMTSKSAAGGNSEVDEYDDMSGPPKFAPGVYSR